MNLYLRLLWALLRSGRAAPLRPGDMIERMFRVWPNDIDVNGHMNNGRYLTVIDLMLVEYLMRTGFAHAMLRAGWRPMAGGVVIRYRKALRPFERYRIRFKLAAADRYWNYMPFEFLRRDGMLCASGLVKGAAVRRGGLVPNSETYAKSGHAFAETRMPEAVRHWLASEAAMAQQPEAQGLPNEHGGGPRTHADLEALRVMGRPLFHPGVVMASPAVMLHLVQNVHPHHLLVSRHARGDYGDLCAGGILFNDQSILDGGRILSEYAVGGSKILVITGESSTPANGVELVTTLLFDREYRARWDAGMGDGAG